MHRILISRCLLGHSVRYDGSGKLLHHPLLDLWREQQRLAPICPELEGGLGCPRPIAEISGGDGLQVLRGQTQVRLQDHTDVSAAFIQGANAALRLCQEQSIHFALLKARSPSCGSTSSYDGSFSGTIIDNGIGVTAALLRQHGIQIFDETQLDELAVVLEETPIA